jgi:hypothetical protein
VPRKKSDPGRAGHIEGCSIAERRDFLDRRDPEQPVANAPQEELENGQGADGAEALRWVRDLAAGECCVELVDPDRYASFAADPLGESDVVAVTMG